jgi:hypothetical protein
VQSSSPLHTKLKQFGLNMEPDKGFHLSPGVRLQSPVLLDLLVMNFDSQLLCLVLQLTLEEKREFAMQLELLAKESEGLPIPLALENGLIVPPVHLSNIPYVR